mgnify:CR=1 FL=1
MGFTVQQLSLGCFRDSRDPYGNPWQRLAASTLRKRRGTSAQILVDTGTLRRQSVTYRAAANSVELGSNLAYAAIHQFGGRAGRNRSTAIPRRAYLPFDASGNANLPDPWERQCIDVIEAEAARVIP